MTTLAVPDISADASSMPGSEASLDRFFSPRNIAVIGASDQPGSVGAALISNLQQGSFGGRIYPVNPKRNLVGGQACYPNVAAVPGKVDLAVIATPAAGVPQIVRECVSAGIGAAIIISAGFREIGETGTALEREIVSAAAGRIRIIGPNCLGLMNPSSGLNASFAASMARPGHIAFLSQSGALCTAILGWSRREMVGFSAFISTGEMIDVGWGDLIRYFGDDPLTRSIVIYMESVGDARDFMSAAREVALSKPIIVIRPGRTEAGARAAASHTGALTGQDDVLDAAFDRCGILRVGTIAELFYLAEALDKQPRPRGPNLAIVTNAGGPAVLAADSLLSSGGRLTELSDETRKALDDFLPPHWSRQNPIDILGDATPERYARAVELAANDPATDGVLVILTPQHMTDPSAVGRHVENLNFQGKPVLMSWMGGADVAQGEEILTRAGIPCYAWPDAAARVFSLMWRYQANIKALYETPESPASEDLTQAKAREEADVFLKTIRASGRTLLSEDESRKILAAYGVPVVQAEVATDVEQAVSAAARIGYPVAVKLHSRTIAHKSDVGGVRLNLRDEAAVRNAWSGIASSVKQIAGPGHFDGVTVQQMISAEGYELILGSNTDPQFGPVVMFGAGGQLVEILKDRALGLPPLNTTLARSLIMRTRIAKALEGVRGRKPVDVPALERLLVRFSFLVASHNEIREIDINPLLASPDGFVALDARIVLHDQSVAKLPRPAIRAYPVQYISSWSFSDGKEVLFRPIRPEDEPSMADFHRMLSAASVEQRYFHAFSLNERISHERLVRACFGDYDREIALVAECSGENGRRCIIGVGRLIRNRSEGEAEMSLIVADRYQSRGLGLATAQRLIAIAAAEKMHRLTTWILSTNQRMISICSMLGFRIGFPSDGVVQGDLDIRTEKSSTAG